MFLENKMVKSIDATNAIEEIKLGNITQDKIDFNLISEILIHHHDELVESKGFRKHFKDNHINNRRLREFIHYVLTVFKRVYPDEPKFYTYVMQQMDDNERFTQDIFDNLLENMQTLIEFYNNRINIMDILIQENSKSVKNLNVLKTNIENGNFLSDDGERFFQFCLLEHTKKKIYETGIVPIGWLPSDVSKMSKLLEKLDVSQGNNNETTERLRKVAMVNAMYHISGIRKS